MFRDHNILSAFGPGVALGSVLWACAQPATVLPLSVSASGCSHRAIQRRVRTMTRTQSEEGLRLIIKRRFRR
jgi:hypothetical protein